MIRMDFEDGRSEDILMESNAFDIGLNGKLVKSDADKELSVYGLFTNSTVDHEIENWYGYLNRFVDVSWIK